MNFSILAVWFGILCASCGAADESKSCALEINSRIECSPDEPKNDALCVSRGCCWQESTDPIPSCFYPSNYPGYVAVTENSSVGSYSATLQRQQASYWPEDVSELVVSVRQEATYRLHVRITDSSRPRFEVPFVVKNHSDYISPEADFEWNVSKSPFALKMQRKSTGSVLLKTDAGPFMFANQFIQFSSQLPPSSSVYGLGEVRDHLTRSTNWTRHVLFARDQQPRENTNLYGVHPFFVVLEADGSCFGVFLLNANAQEFLFQPGPIVTWRSIGGIIDFYVFTGPTPTMVIQQFQELIGLPAIPPYWSLGFHICKYGYHTLDEVETVVKEMQATGIPYDTQWIDLDYARDKLIFTVDPVRYAGLTDFTQRIHDSGMRLVVIIDPALGVVDDGTYEPFELAKQLGILVLNSTDELLIGRVWPNRTAWLDFTNPLSFPYWQDMIAKFRALVPVDGLWIDMNEPSNFVNGSLDGCPLSSLDVPPYAPGTVRLFDFTICMSAKHHLGAHYDLHNLYGYTMAMATYPALVNILATRPFVLSRSTFPGQAPFGAHWTGDNAATYHDMAISIPEVLTFSLFGIPFVGPDICGYYSDYLDEPLCQRWQQLGAFYPFSRNHACLLMGGNKLCPRHDPAMFSKAMQESTRKAYLIRYSLLPYLYTLLYRANQTGETVARPLFVEFPGDPETHGIEAQFLWGKCLLITPVLEENATSVRGYFPRRPWYDWYSGGETQPRRPVYDLYSGQAPEPGKWLNLDAPSDTIPLHLAGGCIVPSQLPAVTTVLSRKNPFTLLIAPDDDMNATGELYWDDGDSLGVYSATSFNLIRFIFQQDRFWSFPLKIDFNSPMPLTNITVMGYYHSAPNRVLLNDTEPLKFAFVPRYNVVHISGSDIDLKWPFTLDIL